jgi:hypothetical protein
MVFAMAFAPPRAARFVLWLRALRDGGPGGVQAARCSSQMARRSIAILVIKLNGKNIERFAALMRQAELEELQPE